METSATSYPGSLYVRRLDDGRAITVYPMIFSNRLCIGPDDGANIDKAWCYTDRTRALEAAREWDGEGDPPVGWHREIGHPWRRRTNGDPALETSGKP